MPFKESTLIFLSLIPWTNLLNCWLVKLLRFLAFTGLFCKLIPAKLGNLVNNSAKSISFIWLPKRLRPFNFPLLGKVFKKFKLVRLLLEAFIPLRLANSLKLLISPVNCLLALLQFSHLPAKFWWQVEHW